jgi:protein-tyrosine-phosphatase/predicted ATP-grasp superfamily ATP-dependent carboligase
MNCSAEHGGRVLVLGRGERAFLAVIRSLGRAGMAVDVGMCGSEEISLRSRYVRRLVQLPPYIEGDGRWLEAMRTVLTEEDYDLIVPCNDHAVIPVQLYATELSQYAIPYALPAEAFGVAFDKIRSYETALSLDVPQARGLICSTTSLDPSRDIKLRYPVVVKPPSSYTATDLASKRHVRRVRRVEEWADLLDEVRPWGRVLVQENFCGIGVGVEVLAKEGNVLFALQHERVHEPLEGGGSSYRRTVPLDAGMLAAARLLMKAIGHTGVAMVEFKWNPSTNEWVFIEINGRFWGSLPVALAAGADFPLYLYKMLVLGETSFPQAYQVNVYGRNVASDIHWFRKNLRANYRDPFLCAKPVTEVFGEVVNLVLGRERWDTLTFDDPAPALRECRNAIARIWRRVTSAGRRVIANTAYSKKLTSCRLQRRLAAARRIVFVCKGNICRSPFAEMYAARVLPAHVMVSSCGYHPVASRSSPVVAQRVSMDFGVNLDEHRSRVMDKESLQDADVIFVFDEENFRRVTREMSRGGRLRVFLLGSVVDGSRREIADPYSGDRAVFESAYRAISDCVNRVAAMFARMDTPC